MSGRIAIVSLIVLCSLNIACMDPDRSSSVLLQGFHWKSCDYNWWSIIREHAGSISQAGFDLVWLPPVSSSAASQGYLPNKLYCLDSAYGDQAALESAIQALKSKNIKPVADIVINHRVGTTNWGDFTQPEWGPDTVCSDDEWFAAQGGHDTGYGYHAARDLDHNNPTVRQGIIDWMNWLKNDIGFSGWRYDFVKGYHGSFNDMYNQATSALFSVGEYWPDLDVYNPDHNRQLICNWIDAASGNSCAFDFTTKGLLQHAFRTSEFHRLRDSNGKPAGLIGWWPERSVTFIDNHDTGPSPGGGQDHWPFPSDKIIAGYSYLLTHPGIPCVYWPHFFDWGNQNKQEITNLIKARKAAGINSGSPVHIAEADESKYAAFIGSKLAMKIGWGDWNPGEGWHLYCTGNDYTVWTK